MVWSHRMTIFGRFFIEDRIWKYTVSARKKNQERNKWPRLSLEMTKSKFQGTKKPVITNKPETSYP